MTNDGTNCPDPFLCLKGLFSIELNSTLANYSHSSCLMNMNTSSRQLSMTSLAHIGNITRTMLVTLILIKYNKATFWRNVSNRRRIHRITDSLQLFSQFSRLISIQHNLLWECGSREDKLRENLSPPLKLYCKDYLHVLRAYPVTTGGHWDKAMALLHKNDYLKQEHPTRVDKGSKNDRTTIFTNAS